MSIILSPYPKLQFIDNNGVPMANCLLYTYEAGTSTPVATYTDSTGTAFNSNPIILDAGGRADIWLDSNTSYKYILKNFDGSILFTVDNINSEQQGLIISVKDISSLRQIDTSFLTSATVEVSYYSTLNDGGGGTFYFDPLSPLSDDGGMVIAPNVGTGKWIRIANSEINVLWYGAVGDNVTDNRAAFQLANSYASLNSWNLYLPNGKYYLSSNPVFSVMVRFAPYAVLKFFGFALKIYPQIDDKTNKHFDCQSSAYVNFGSSLDTIYPEWFGAVGDGSMSGNVPGTDDTTAIQTCLNSCSLGCAVAFKTSKKYWCNTINPVPGTSIVGVMGSENDSSALPAAEFTANLQYIGGNTGNFIDLSNSDIGGLTGIKIKDLIIDGNAQAICAIKLQTVESAHLRLWRL